MRAAAMFDCGRRQVDVVAELGVSAQTASPRRARRLDADQIQELIAGYGRATVCGLGARFGIGRRTVNAVLRRHGVGGQ